MHVTEQKRQNGKERTWPHLVHTVITPRNIESGDRTNDF